MQLQVRSPNAGQNSLQSSGAAFWEGDAMKNFSVVFFLSEKGRHSVNEGLGKDFYMKSNAVKGSRPISEPPDSDNSKVAVLVPFPKKANQLLALLAHLLSSAQWLI